MSWYNGIAPVYYPTTDSKEADAAYAAWQNHYSQWPCAYSVYQVPPQGVWQFQQAPQVPNYMYGYPAPPAIPQPAYYGWAPEPESATKSKKKQEGKKEKDDEDDDNDNMWGNAKPTAGAYWDGYRWVTVEKEKEKKEKKKDKGDEEVEYVAHYVPAGESPHFGDGVQSDGKYHYNFYGRSATEVHEDRHRQAVDSGVYKPKKKVPDAGADDRFWVVDQKTGRAGLEYFSDIKNLEGDWKVDNTPGRGNDYFAKTGAKTGGGWDSD